jgi:membrane-bound inhibitor of C-type lysozyme
VTSIGEVAFWGCTGLTSVTIPNSVTRIGYDVFRDCTGLTSIIVSCEKYDYFQREISQYSSIVYGDCYFVIATIVNNENYGTVTGSGVFKKGQTIPLTATANDHYHFVKWNDNNTQNPRTVQVTRDSTFTAIFAIDEHNVTLSKNISAAGTVTGNGVYEYNTTVQLTATANEGYHFVKWNDNNTQNPRTVQVTQDRTFTAVFAIDEHNVTANANNKNYGTVTGEGVYEYGTSITLTATPNDHYHFVKWNDDNTDNPRTVQVTQDRTFTAIFAIDEHNVTLSKNISAAGTVTGDGVYEHNTTVQLTATANEGYRFKGWSDGVTESSREILVTKDLNITANFVALYTIKALASASQGTVSGGGVYEKGETATLVANAKPGYIFAQWADGNDENPRYVTVKGNKTYTAIFRDPDAATTAPEAEESIVETARYDINGRPLNAPTKGVNIVKYSDGSFEKEFVK